MVKDRKSTETSTQLHKPHRFTLEQWRVMVDSGVFQKNERLEFVEGQILVMSPVNRPHSSCVNRLNALLSESLGRKAIVAIQNPLLVGSDEFYPDVALLKPRADFYDDKDAEAEDTFLVIEVADTTLKTDQELKAAKYAAGEVQEYWIVDLNHSRVWVYREPKDGAYTQIQACERGTTLSPQQLPEIQLTVEQIIGKSLT